MKNYANDREYEKDFILNYYVADNQIIVNTASGDKCVYSYSKENEIMILEKMKKQVLDAYEKINLYHNKFAKLCIFEPIIFGFVITNMYSIMSKKTDTLSLSILFEIVFSMWGILNSTSLVKKMQCLNDIKKNYLFIQNEELFKKANLCSLKKINDKTRKYLTSKDNISLNDMDNFSYRNIKKITDELRFDSEFDNKVKIKRK